MFGRFINRLVFLALLTQVFARINHTKLHNLNIADCDLMPASRYRIVSDATHYFIFTDGSVTADDTAHIFSLLHCSLPSSDRVFVHSFSLIGEVSNEMCKDCSPFNFIRSRINDFHVSLTPAAIHSLCRFIHFTRHPRNSIVLLFMKPFDCNASKLPDIHLRRVVFFQTGEKQIVEHTDGHVKGVNIYTLNLDTPTHMALLHSAAYSIISRDAPRLQSVTVAAVPEYTEDQSAKLIAGLITSIVLILSIALYLVLVCCTVVNATRVKYSNPMAQHVSGGKEYYSR